MTTKTDYRAVMELRKVYTPANRGIVTDGEEKLIREILELDSRNDIELQNIRDTVVMLYVRWAGSPKKSGSIPAIVGVMDAMSSVCCIIDTEKSKRGLSL